VPGPKPAIRCRVKVMIELSTPRSVYTLAHEETSWFEIIHNVGNVIPSRPWFRSLTPQRFELPGVGFGKRLDLVSDLNISFDFVR
jgi:hypothetical protein